MVRNLPLYESCPVVHFYPYCFLAPAIALEQYLVAFPNVHLPLGGVL